MTGIITVKIVPSTAPLIVSTRLRSGKKNEPNVIKITRIVLKK